jgi:CTP:molybdopterin cytidylyltransferase MocA
MSETSSISLFRFTCPHCQKVLKARTEWAGRRGVCPTCNQAIQFPSYTPPSAASRTAQQLLQLVAHGDNPALTDADSDRLAMLLSQGTCRDYSLARKLLAARAQAGGSAFSPRQWRRVLNSAAARESMRLHIEEQLERLAEIPDDDSEPAAILAAADAAAVANPNAWTIIARYLYFIRHDTCEQCREDPTGLSCIYLTLESFTAARHISAERAANWQKICHHHLGL